MTLKQHVKLLMREMFELGQRFGFDILPRHFYSEIPDIRQLRSTEGWKKPRSMNQIAGADIASQLAFVQACTTGLSSITSGASLHDRACKMNGIPEGYGRIEADFLYCFVRSQKPQVIVQIGCGLSTAICILAAADAGYKPEIICIEPYPTAFLQSQAAAGAIRLIAEKFQDSKITIPELLGEGGLFFVDSTHTLGPAGEVTEIICEILPTLVQGTWVHFHDIVFPYDYQPEMLTTELFFGHETALLYAFLVQNGRYRIVASLSMLHHAAPTELAASLPNYKPASFDRGLRLTEGDFPSAVFLYVS